ncbi:LacI family DNA-binding transcriptional regulator [Succinivibrio dextrinosolvens]|uniref:LacI family DNA-binding transcriptional regulator n=1 Tax=Succinivibrio dextrinosolvens TaxID=83771 RepID=UPI002478BBD4|nr:LacI family DNA-binding transcriptional regulator [Succinivibrio dextrinosolvens]
MRNTRYKTHEIAKLAGVSPASVSRAINHPELLSDESLEKIKSTMHAMGYDLDEIFNKEPKEIILINFPHGTNPFYEEVIEGIISSADSNGYYTLLNYTRLDENNIEDFIKMVKVAKVKGIITLSQVPSDLLNMINAVVPVVQCCEFNERSTLPYVSIDDYMAAKNAVKYLIASGRKKIAFLNGPKRFKYSRERLRGFLDALSDDDISIPDEWIMHVPHIEYQMADTLISRILSDDNKPDAVFAASDVLAAAVVNRAVYSDLKVPDDLMVIGFDNISLCQVVRPSLTSVHQPKHKLGFTACEMLHEKIKGKTLKVNEVLLSTELVIRGSTEHQ